MKLEIALTLGLLATSAMAQDANTINYYRAQAFRANWQASLHGLDILSNPPPIQATPPQTNGGWARLQIVQIKERLGGWVRCSTASHADVLLANLDSHADDVLRLNQLVQTIHANGLTNHWGFTTSPHYHEVIAANAIKDNAEKWASWAAYQWAKPTGRNFAGLEIWDCGVKDALAHINLPTQPLPHQPLSRGQVWHY